MLPRHHRLTTAAQFSTAVRSGARAGGPLLVVHLVPDDADPDLRVGFVVSKAVGVAVVRNKVKRRLRHLVRERLGDLPRGLLVVRAQPAAAQASYAELGRALDRCLQRALDRPGAATSGRESV
ncbi:ribonuclease P protein component [Alteromonas gracilis]